MQLSAFALSSKGNNSWHLFSFCKVPGTMLSPLHYLQFLLQPYKVIIVPHLWTRRLRPREVLNGHLENPVFKLRSEAPFLNDHPRSSTNHPWSPAQPTAGPVCIITKGHLLGNPVSWLAGLHRPRAGAGLGSKTLCHLHLGI